MLTALISFFGGSAFRMIWGEVSAWITKGQEHKHELELLDKQGELESARHERDMARVKLASDLGIKEIQIAGDVAIQKGEMEAWLQAVRDVGKTTGIRFVDIWNGSIRPALATIAILAVVAGIIQNGFVLTDWDKSLIGAILGIYVADRSLIKRGK